MIWMGFEHLVNTFGCLVKLAHIFIKHSQIYQGIYINGRGRDYLFVIVDGGFFIAVKVAAISQVEKSFLVVGR